MKKYNVSDMKNLAQDAKDNQNKLNAAIIHLLSYIDENNQSKQVQALINKDGSLYRKLRWFRSDITWARIAKSWNTLAENS